MRVERLVESRAAVIELTVEEAAGLVAVGRRLASQSRHWGDRDFERAGKRSLIECEPYGLGRWSVRIPNAVGVLRVDELQLVVEPKIPLPHLLHLFERSGAFPRVDSSLADLSTAESLWPLVAAWYIVSLEHLIRSGLASGYRQANAELVAARGRIRTDATSRAFLKGRVIIDCEYEEFDVDTPLNRVLRSAAEAVASSAALTWDLRRRASRAIDHMEGVSRLLASDRVAAEPERHTSRYAVPLQLAGHVLAATGRGIDAGEEHGHAFLIRTPDMAEEGLRQIASDALRGKTTVSKRTRFLVGSHHSLTPDLVFGTRAIGDVKYKLWAGDWDRADLYQLVTFATGFGVHSALRVGFSPVRHDAAPVTVGPVRAAVADWLCDATIDPVEAERMLAAQLRAWWGETERYASDQVERPSESQARAS